MALEGVPGIIRYLDSMVGAIISESKTRISVVAAKDAEGLIKYRVFTQGDGAADGSLLSPYKRDEEGKLKPYGRKRAKSGRRVDKKDLEFTGTLRGAIETISIESSPKSATAVVHILATPYPKGANTLEVAGYLEETEGKDIFNLSEKEADEVILNVEKEIKKIINKFK